MVDRTTLLDALGLDAPLERGEGALVSFIGAGGKTSLMFALALEASARWGSRRVLVTTTTRIYEPAAKDLPPLAGPVGRPPLALKLTQDLGRALEMVGRAGRESPPGGAIWILGTGLLPATGAGPDPERRKVAGVPVDWVIELRRRFPELLLVVEADGSAGRPLKAPGPHEPVLPPCPGLVLAVAGIDVLGEPLDESHVHRPERAAALCGCPPGQPLRPRDVAAVLAGAAGRAGLPQGARMVPALNKADAAGAIAASREVAAGLAALGYPETLVTSCLTWPVVVEAGRQPPAR